MATGHWLTNRGKLRLAQGKWDSLGGTLIRAGLLVASQPVAVDTAAEVADLNFVSDLLVTAGATECSLAGYARQNLTRSAAAEDDANDRVNLDASDISWGALPAGQTLYGTFYYSAETDTSDSTRELLSIDWYATPVPTNGAACTTPIADLYRLS